MKQLKIGNLITNRDSESLDRYLTEISKLGMISPEEEVDLARRIRGGDKLALEKMTKANLRFVVSVAKQYQNRGLPLIDLINEGNVGLIKAGLRFDETRGFKFISYAVWWIRQSIIHAIADQSRVIRLPLNKVVVLTKISRAYSELEQQLEREPTPEELGQCIGITAESVAENLHASQRTISADAPVHHEDNISVMETIRDRNSIAPDGSLMDGALKEEIRRVLGTLTRREMEIIVLYFGLNNQQPLTLDEIGLKFSLTRERVRQIKEKATRELRKSNRAGTLRSFLG